MIKEFGMIMAIWFFIIPISPSMALGSVSGFGGGWLRFSGSLRNAPDSNAVINAPRRDVKLDLDSTK